MTIYVDVSSAVHSKAGLGRYAASLVSALEPIVGDRLALFQNSLGRQGPLLGWEDYPLAGVRHGYRPWRAMVWLAQLARWPMDRLVPDARLFHATEHLLPSFAHIPTVLTVHDLIFEHLPQHHKRMNYLYLRATMPLYCRRATAIIAVSEATRRDLLERYRLDPCKVHMIPEAAAPHFRPQPAAQVEEVRRRYGLPSRYVVTVGTIEPRKNLSRLMDACAPLLAEGAIDALVIVGGRGWLYEGFFQHLEASPWRERVILPGYVADEELPAVYAGAQICVQPSLYEGFGLPVLEAMACGTPVCAADNSSLPEVGGHAARYFRATDEEEMTDVIRSVLHDEAERHEMVARGLERAASFSWDRTAEATVALYERVLASW